MNDINSVKLKNKDHFNVKKCVLCQKGSKKNDVLIGTENRRAKVISAAKTLDNRRILNRSVHNSFLYHLHPCYSSYVRRAERAQKKDAGNTKGQSEDTVMKETGHDVGCGVTRSQIGIVSSPVREIYIACGCAKK